MGVFMPDDNQGTSQNAQDQNQKPTLDEATIGNFVNAAVTNQLKRYQEKQEKALQDQLKAFGEQLKSSLAPAPQADPDDKSKKNGPDPRIAALEQQLQEMKQQAQDAESKRLATEKKAREDRAFNDFRSELSKVVRPETLDVVAGYLFKVQGVVEVGEDGEAVYKSSRTTLGVEEEVRLPIKDGVASWAKSDFAKPYLPSPGTSSAPQTKKPGHPITQLPEKLDLSTASDEQKLALASQQEAEIQRKLAEAGIKF
jgi:hypothetical protein